MASRTPGLRHPAPRPRRRLQGLVAALVLVILAAAVIALAQSRHRATPAVVPVIDMASGVLLAAPNPVLAGSGVGTTVISWIVPNNAIGQVWVSADGQPDVLFTQGASGAAYASFIEKGKRYEFRLYPGTTHTGQPLKSVVVTR